MTPYEALLRLHAMCWATGARAAHRARLHRLSALCEARELDRRTDAVEVRWAYDFTPVCPVCGHRHPEEH